MTLQQLIGELQALSMAYPPESEVLVKGTGVSAPVTGVSGESDESGVTIFLEAAL